MERVIRLEIGRRRVTLLLPDAPSAAVYLHESAEDAGKAWALLGERRPALTAVEGVDWNGELSPWPAARAFRGGEDFAGGADAWMEELTGTIIPAVEREMDAPRLRCIAGYSLAGLFAAYAAYRSDAFHAIASMSGSMWFDGFAEFAAEAPFCRRPLSAFFSLGDRERMTRNPRLAAVEERTRAVEQVFRGRGVRTKLVLNPGGHFQDVPRRIAEGIAGALALAEEAGNP